MHRLFSEAVVGREQLYRIICVIHSSWIPDTCVIHIICSSGFDVCHWPHFFLVLLFGYLYDSRLCSVVQYHSIASTVCRESCNFIGQCNVCVAQYYWPMQCNSIRRQQCVSWVVLYYWPVQCLCSAILLEGSSVVCHWLSRECSVMARPCCPVASITLILILMMSYFLVFFCTIVSNCTAQQNANFHHISRDSDSSISTYLTLG